MLLLLGYYILIQPITVVGHVRTEIINYAIIDKSITFNMPQMALNRQFAMIDTAPFRPMSSDANQF